ncbi:hypothetical protein NQ317_014366 [Molorchus minor]|uniref:Uncharacterized protein n=1 Tax=Molorchus minor TaxID=1323400 RepID=A0ABQ9K530_9CUCU|nr:hypothetical protein NQ317_014366 [Molorchus minor]
MRLIITKKTDPLQSKSEKTEILSSANLIKAEVMSSRSEICDSKEKKDEINSNVAVKSSTEEKTLKLTSPRAPSKFAMPFQQSREQAGKPDGREDPVIAELPPLPITPPPVLESQTSFLHGSVPPTFEKPKIPSKPSAMVLRKITAVSPPQLSNDKAIEKTPLSKQDSNDSDTKGNKRRAPHASGRSNRDHLREELRPNQSRFSGS